MPNLGRGLWTPPFWDFVGIFCCQWGQGPTDAQRPGPFVREGGLLGAPSQALFTRTFRFSPPQVLFFWGGPSWPDATDSQTRVSD